MVHGIINIKKEKGFTSHDVVAKLRGIVGQKKIGHTGTLDPDATGVLPVCLGKATKLCDLLTDKDKTYETVLLLGKVTDTQDITGTVISEAPIDGIDNDAVEKCIGEFVGEYLQVPPMYSALKVNGKKLYELAREGIEIERKARPVKIYQIHIKRIELPRVWMEVACSKGTYIRTLCHDIGEKLGCGGCMEELTRTKVSSFEWKDSYTLDEVKAIKEKGELANILIPIDQMFLDCEPITLKRENESLAYNGNIFGEKHIQEKVTLSDGMRVRVYDQKGQFIAIYQYCQNQKIFKIVKMFFDRK